MICCHVGSAVLFPLWIVSVHLHEILFRTELGPSKWTVDLQWERASQSTGHSRRREARADGGRSYHSQTKPASSAQLPTPFLAPPLTDTTTSNEEHEKMCGEAHRWEQTSGGRKSLRFCPKGEMARRIKRREGKERGREEQREKKVRGSREREAGQQWSVSAKQAENNRQLEGEGRQLRKICSRDSAPKSWQLAPVTTSLLAQAPRVDWVTEMDRTHWCPGRCPHDLLPSIPMLVYLLRPLQLSLHLPPLYCLGASAVPIHRADAQTLHAPASACACLACYLSCHPDLESGALTAQKYWSFPQTSQASCGVAHAAFSI